jgi:RNase P/RNase MRP subunit POP5
VVELREKKRYVIVAVESEEKLNEQNAKRLLSQAVLEILGEAGAGDASFAFKEFDSEKQEAVIKCSTKSLERVIAALALKRFFEGKNVALRVLEVKGSFVPAKRSKTNL